MSTVLHSKLWCTLYCIYSFVGVTITITMHSLNSLTVLIVQPVYYLYELDLCYGWDYDLEGITIIHAFREFFTFYRH